MSIQARKYTSKSTGKTTTTYYAVIYDKRTNKTAWSKGFKSEKDARREEARMLNDLDENLLVTKKIKFGQAMELWLEYAEKEYANSTYKGYVWYCGKFIEPVFNDKDITSILPLHIQRFVDALDTKYSAETINKNLNILSNIFNYANEFLHAVKSNPVEPIKRKKVKQKKIVTWNQEQISNFLNYKEVVESPYYELILTSFLLGARPSEVCGLRTNNLKSNRILKFDRGYDRYGEETNMETNRSHREMIISNEHYDKLINRLKEQNHQAIKSAEQDLEYDNNDFLFKQENGKPINPEVYSKNFKKLLRKYNEDPFNKAKDLLLPDISLYEARHSFATNLVSEGNVNTALVASIMGNSERTCNDRYVHPYQEAKENVLVGYQQGIFDSEDKEDAVKTDQSLAN